MKRTLNILIVILVLDLLGAGAIWFGYSTIAKKKGEETALRKELSEEIKKVAQQSLLRRALKQAEKERGALAKYFYDPGEESQIKFVAAIEALGLPASGALVETGSFNFVGGGKPNFHGEFTLTGRWGEIYHFLRLIEEFPARLVIQRFSAQSTGGKNAGGAVWNGSVSLELESIKSI